jgi:hypothetical protein
MRSYLKTLRASARNDDGAIDLIAFMFGSVAIMLLLIGVVFTYNFREMARQPVEQLVDTYTQMFASYGSDVLPIYAPVCFGVPAGECSVTLMLTHALEEAPSVKSVTSVECGQLDVNGRLDSANSLIYANSPVGCITKVELKGWPYVAPGAEMIFGGKYVAFKTGYTDRGANPNLQ